MNGRELIAALHTSDISLVQETLQRDFAKFRGELDGEGSGEEGEGIII